MTGGELKIEVLPAGAVVPAFGLLDAVSKGTLDGGHGVLVYHYGKQNALALWGSGPAFGMDANTLLAWHKYGGGKQLLDKLYKSIGANVVSLCLRPDADAAARLVQEADHQGGGLSRASSSAPSASPSTSSQAWARGERAARRRDRAGHGPRVFSTRRSSTTPAPTAARVSGRLEGLHAAELSPERRAVRDHVQQAESSTRCRPRSRRSSKTPWKRHPPICRGRRSTAIPRTTSSSRPKTR
jgi:hypothetical protein